jgi:hypothetical protein
MRPRIQCAELHPRSAIILVEDVRRAAGIEPNCPSTGEEGAVLPFDCPNRLLRSLYAAAKLLRTGAEDRDAPLAGAAGLTVEPAASTDAQKHRSASAPDNFRMNI